MYPVVANQPKWLVAAPWLFLTLWSGAYVAGKYGLLFAEPLTFLAIRFAAVVAIMVALFIILKPPLPKRRIDWVHLAIVGFLIQSVYFGFCYLAFNTGIAVGTIALILSMQPILVSLAVPRWTGEKIGWQRWGGLILGLVGAAVVITARSNIEPPTLYGISCAFLALFGITAGTLWEKRFGLTHHPVTANLIGYSAGLLGVLPFMFLLETMHVDWTWELLVSLAYLVIGSSVIAIGLFLAMIRAGDVSKVSALFFLIPPLAALVAWALLDEIMPPLAWLGMAIAAIGVFVATRDHKQA